MLECVEFTVTVEENAAFIAELNPNLPIGPCTIEVFNQANNGPVFYLDGGVHIRNVRTHNRTVSQYLFSTDEKQGSIARWKLLQQEMQTKKIKIVIIRVCTKG